MVEESSFRHVGAEANQILAKAFARSSLRSKPSYGNSRLKKPGLHDNENVKLAGRADKLAIKAAGS
jgi:hypothetical protein